MNHYPDSHEYDSKYSHRNSVKYNRDGYSRYAEQMNSGFNQISKMSEMRSQLHYRLTHTCI